MRIKVNDGVLERAHFKTTLMEHMINYDKLIKSLIEQWRDWAVKTKTSKFVIGISGGKDSAVVLGLAIAAFGKESVIPVSMPCGIQGDIDDVIALLKHYDLDDKKITTNIEPAVLSIENTFKTFYIKESKQTKTNLPARIRMATLFAVAQSIPGAKVINTCNLSEDMVGWSTLFGDDSGCYAPLKDLTCTEVKIVGEKIGVPDFIIKKAPSDGLCGKTDEDALGFSYATLDMYIRTGYCENFEDEIKIEEMYNKAKFKQELIQLPHPELGLPNYLKTHNEPRIEIPENLFDT